MVSARRVIAIFIVALVVSPRLARVLLRSSSVVRSDFKNDSYDDLIAGVSREDLGTRPFLL